ncbi:MAG TPA: T9SS type A sorting domain-containing protein, partial [Rubricoccaceae bacterium]
EAAGNALALTVSPNPARFSATLTVTVAEPSSVRVVVVDALGREVAVVLDGAVAAGETVVAVETGAWPAGVYVVRATAGTQTTTARLVVAR